MSTEVLLPVLEPLSKATGELLNPIKLFPNDYLKVGLDDVGQKFITQAIGMRICDNGKEPDHVINGVNYYEADSSGNAAYRWQRRIPERRELGWGKFSFAATDFTALVIHHIWSADKLLFEDGDTKLLYMFLLKRFLSQTRAKTLIANYRINNKIPEMPVDWQDHPDVPLAEYQKIGLLSCLNQEASALFMEQGTGKTPVSISRINYEGYLKRNNKLPGVNPGMYRALIICPKQVRLNWENEFQRFSVRPGKIAVARGSKLHRQRAILDGIRPEEDCEWSATIISTDSIDRTWELLRVVPWDLVVLDESHYIKNPTAKRSAACRLFNQTDARAKMALTGTPIANSVMDLWSQFEFLGEGLSGFMSYSNFRGFHGKFITIGKGVTPIQKLVGVKGLPLIQERLARMAFMITKKEANLGLPDKVYDIEEVEMTPTQRDFYKKIATQLVVQIEEMLEDEEKQMSVDHVLTMLLRLAQITSGHVKWDDEIDPVTGEKTVGHVEQIPGGNPKVNAILEMICHENRDPLGKTIIWCCFIEDMRILSKRMADAGINHVGYHQVIQDGYRIPSADRATEKFNCDPLCKVLIANPASAGEGLNIVGYDRNNEKTSETYCDHEIFMSSNWSMTQRSQAEDRAHRRGTRNNVRITDLVIPGTIDEEIRARVLAKKQTALLIQDVRDILANVVGDIE